MLTSEGVGEPHIVFSLIDIVAMYCMTIGGLVPVCQIADYIVWGTLSHDCTFYYTTITETLVVGLVDL